VPDDISLRNRDIVFVPPIGPKVAVRGSVNRPAIYELGREETLRDIILNAGGVTASADLSRAQIARILPVDERGSLSVVRVVIDIDLRTALFDSTAGIPLVDGDALTVFTVPTDRRNFVVIEGAIWKPGQYEWVEGTTVSQAISAGGGLREEALESRVDLYRTNPDETVTQIALVLKDVMDGTSDDIPLSPRDRIHVYSIHDVFPQQYVKIFGRVGKPGQYLLHGNMTLGDLIVKAEGLTKDAWPTTAEVIRLRYGDNGSVTGFDRHEVPIDTSYSPRGSAGFLLADFDQIFIRQRPQWDVERNVWISGEVVFPGEYSLLRNDERLSEVLERAGGLTSVAYAEGTRYYREYEDAGRINTNLANALQHPASLDDLIMQPGDSLYVPPKVDFVTVRGAVGYPTSVLYVRGRRPEYYVSQAGGITEDGDKRRTRVTLPNGSIWRPRWFILPDPEVQPGSEIYVPIKSTPERDAWEVIRDTTAILSGLTTVLLLVWQISR
ncbi:SLBB domain-containing protein, partial [Gemmatimonadota bacterium]